MPDRFDLSELADLERSLEFAASFCRRASPVSLSAAQHAAIDSAIEWLDDVLAQVQELATTGKATSAIGSLVEAPPAATVRHSSEESLAKLGQLIRSLELPVVRLANKRTVSVQTAAGTVMLPDIARHLVRVVCIASIDPDGR